MSVATATVRYAGGSLSEKSLRRRRVAALAGFIAGMASRHSPSSIEESAAGTSSSLPPGCRLQYRRPRSGIRMAAGTRAQPICLQNYLPPHPSPSGSTAVLSSFSAHRFSVSARAGRLILSAACRQYA